MRRTTRSNELGVEIGRIQQLFGLDEVAFLLTDTLRHSLGYDDAEHPHRAMTDCYCGRAEIQ